MTDSTITTDRHEADWAAGLLQQIRDWGRELGFQALGFTGIELAEHRDYLDKWLAAGYHGEMGWMSSHGEQRSHPESLVPGTCTVITARMDYLPEGADPQSVLADGAQAYVSRYALGRDYHKLMRGRLAKLAKRIEAELGKGHYRAFVDSAPVLERALAENAGLGWIGKNTMLINEKAGSWFFWARSIPIFRFPPMHRRRRSTAAVAAPVSISALQMLSSTLGCSMRANVFPISP